MRISKALVYFDQIDTVTAEGPVLEPTMIPKWPSELVAPAYANIRKDADGNPACFAGIIAFSVLWYILLH